MTTVRKKDGIVMARRFKTLLKERGFPVRRVVLFGSVAKDTAHEQSDIDIAVVTDPFLSSRLDEGSEILLASKDIDIRIQTVTLYREDFDRPFFGLGKELERTGVEV